ncbi:phosphatidylserine/phosphatidylglycerophosphate/cardiolipin synthase family protein [Caballeronia sp. EK]|uniref:phospholipase D-like domain-containing protein n=1 Tax=Caballeronia sp. EK TaxID=2767469 RepID=UPI0016550ABE|nr:phospholipase D-like domain-containing protein [Caballeronia sp. EK]MBC8639887.1 phosphatidylserine/phosphatidylglycerophosphate/cardiolipin synthase family protein [Caballeronia sp. EK]
MSETAAITTPIAQACGNTATLTLPHYVQEAEYKPKAATHRPLVCGEEAFAAVYDAISAAQHTIDIVCWGFQPSMYFKRGTSGQGTVPIGQLLLEKASQNKKIRLLVWGDSLHLAQFSENMMPGGRFTTANDNRNSTQKEFDAWWYGQVKMDRKNATSGLSVNFAARVVRDPAFNRIEFATRDFDVIERAEIAWRSAYDSKYSDRGTHARVMNSVALTSFPTHHQKMVLIDYEYPDVATGFVMGHNTLDEYWDTHGHSHLRLHPQMGRNGFHPRQDISAQVTGPILIDLNANFCQAWDAATGQKLTEQRRSAKQPALRCGQDDVPVMAQILRTQSQYGKHGIRDIEALYLQALNNVSNFIYIENQYFRFPPFAEKLMKLVQAYQAGGRKPPLYLFVVTNSSDEGMGDGTVSTYQMLNALGRSDVLPGVAKLERADDFEKQYKEALDAEKQANQALDRAEHIQIDPFSGSAVGVADYFARLQQDAAQASQHAADVKAKLEGAKTEDPQKVDIPGLKVHICTLVPPDTPKGMQWDEVYIHSKLMIIDDVFVTHGSANVNLRSMQVDSELNICHESARVTQPLREKLWRIHSKGMGVGKKSSSGRLDAEHAFKKWGEIIQTNKIEKLEGLNTPYASLVEFYRDSPKRTYND